MKPSKYHRKYRLYALWVVFVAVSGIGALQGQEYEYEVGVVGGTSFYMGDANKTKLFQNPNIAGGAVFRYNRNFRWAYKANLLVGGVSGNTGKSGNVFPNNEQYSFSRTFVELGGQVEFNFFHYSDKYGYLGTKRFSPYIFTGLGVTYGTGNKSFIGMNLPLGIGLKYKWKERLNLGFEFSFRKLFGDAFDVTSNPGKGSLEDPYDIESSFLKNKDWYVLTMFSVTWDFGQRKKSCINSLY